MTDERATLRAALVAAIQGQPVTYITPTPERARKDAKRILKLAGLAYPRTLTIVAPPTVQPPAVSLSAQPGPSVARSVKAIMGSAWVQALTAGRLRV